MVHFLVLAQELRPSTTRSQLPSQSSSTLMGSEPPVLVVYCRSALLQLLAAPTDREETATDREGTAMDREGTASPMVLGPACPAMVELDHQARLVLDSLLLAALLLLTVDLVVAAAAAAARSSFA